MTLTEPCIIPVRWGETRVKFRGNGFVGLDIERTIVPDSTRPRNHRAKDQRKVVVLPSIAPDSRWEEVKQWLRDNGHKPDKSIIIDGDRERLAFEFKTIKAASIFKLFFG